MELDFNYYTKLASQYNKASMALVLAKDALAPIANQATESSDSVTKSDVQNAKDLQRKILELSQPVQQGQYGAGVGKRRSSPNRHQATKSSDSVTKSDAQNAKDLQRKILELQKEIRKEAYQNEELAANAAMDELFF